MSKPDLILTGDIHLRDTTPECRIDNYWKAQESKFVFILELQNRYNCPILDAGDLFHNWKSSPYLEAWAIRELSRIKKDYYITIPGNHEIPYHNINYLYRSSLAVLEASNSIMILTKEKPMFSTRNIDIVGFPWGVKPTEYKGNNIGVAVVHTLVYEKEHIWPGLEADKGIDFLKKMKGYSLVVTGHNHLPFISKYKERYLVNPGSMMRGQADQINHKPRVYLWYKEGNVETMFLPIKENVINRSYLEDKKKKEERMISFALKLNDSYEKGMSFENNFNSYFEKNRVRQSVKDLIFNTIEKCKNSIGE